MINQYVPDGIKCQKYTKKFILRGGRISSIMIDQKCEWLRVGGASFANPKMKIDLAFFIYNFINLNKQLKHKQMFKV